MSDKPDNINENEAPHRLWELSQKAGLDRRRFLQILAAGGSAAVLSTLGAIPVIGQDEALQVKSSEGFIDLGKNLEALLENMGGFITPNEQFFVRNNSKTIEVDVESYSLMIDGDAIETPIELSYEDILNLPSRTVFSFVECGGNQRGMFAEVMGQEAGGTQWGRGGISMAIWDGVSLADVLALAGVSDNAVDVLLVGTDTESPEEGFRRAMTIEKAMDPDTILAYRMNGAILPPDHGYPIRGIVPGWVGSSNVKWLGRIEVSSETLYTRNNSTSYVLIGEDYPAPTDNQLGIPVYEQSVKSSLILPWPAELSAGTQTIRGYAHSGGGEIVGVEYSLDGGSTWTAARLIDPAMRYAWTRFEFEWDATAGDHIIMTRATDAAGNVQSNDLPFNEKGYLFNMPLPHPISVS